MDKKDFKEIAARLEEVGKVIEKLPSEIRSASFELLESYVAGDFKRTSKRSAKGEMDEQPSDPADAGEFFTKFNHDKPADNIKLIAAHLYSQYGAEPFATDEIRQIANDVGVTIPSRPDATLDAAKDKGKALFIRSGKGKFKVTVHGEAFLKTAYAVKKGTQKRQVAATK